MSALDRILFHTDPTGVFVLAFVLAIAALLVGRICWRLVCLAASISWELTRAGLLGRRERLERERRRLAARATRPGPNWLAADLRRQREGAQS